MIGQKSAADVTTQLALARNYRISELKRLKQKQYTGVTNLQTYYLHSLKQLMKLYEILLSLIIWITKQT